MWFWSVARRPRRLLFFHSRRNLWRRRRHCLFFTDDSSVPLPFFYFPIVLHLRYDNGQWHYSQCHMCFYGTGRFSNCQYLLSVSSTTPLDTLILSGVNLTKIPSTSTRRFASSENFIRATTKSLLTPFTLLNHVDLSSNVITSIGTGDLALKGPVKFLNLANNVISSIAAGSLPSEFFY